MQRPALKRPARGGRFGVPCCAEHYTRTSSCHDNLGVVLAALGDQSLQSTVSTSALNRRRIRLRALQSCHRVRGPRPRPDAIQGFSRASALEPQNYDAHRALGSCGSRKASAVARSIILRGPTSCGAVMTERRWRRGHSTAPRAKSYCTTPSNFATCRSVCATVNGSRYWREITTARERASASSR